MNVKNLNEAYCYTNLANAQYVAMNMLSAAHRLASSATILHNVDDLKRHIDNLAKFSEIARNMDMTVLDSIRICTCFENYIKARLIEKRFIVHFIDSKKIPKEYKQLRKTQWKRPIRVSEIKTIEGLRYKRGIDYHFTTIKAKTIGLSILLEQPMYVAEYKIDPTILKALNRINGKRNTLHCLIGDTAFYSNTILDDYVRIRNFINMELITRHEKLRLKFGFPIVHKLREIGTENGHY